MSTIYLHVGQAGNEIGGAFWQLAAAERPPRRWLLDERGRCRCVLVDTEPKVVRGVSQMLGPDRLYPQCALVDQSGRGNHLNRAPWGGASRHYEKGVNASKHKLTVGGHTVYGAYFEGGMGYRCDSTWGVATGNEPESM